MTRRHAWALAAVLALGAALRAWHVGVPSLWVDEAFNAWAVRQDWSGLIAASAGDNHPPLYGVQLPTAPPLQP